MREKGEEGERENMMAEREDPPSWVGVGKLRLVEGEMGVKVC